MKNVKLSMNLLHYPKFDSKPFKMISNNENMNKNSVKFYRGYKSKHIVMLPSVITPKLSYLLGVILGDDSIKKPIKRKVDITGL